MVRKVIKKFATLIVVVLSVLLVGTGGLMVLFQLPGFQRRATLLVERELRSSTGLPVSVGSLRYAPFATFELQRVEVCDADTLPMLRLRRVKAELAFASLWHRRIEVNAVVCDSLDVTLRELPGGGYNISSLMRADSASSSSTSIGLRVGSFQARGCDVRLLRQRGDTLGLAGATIDVRDLTNGPEGLTVDVRNLSFDVVAVGAPRRAGLEGRVALRGDTVSLSDLSLTLGLSLARVSHLTLATDTGGVAWADCDVPALHVSSELLSAAAGVPLPALNGSVAARLDSAQLTLDRVRLALGKESFAELQGHVYRQWRSRPSEVHIVEARTNGEDLCQIAPGVLSASQARSIGRVTLAGSARLDESTARLTLSARADQATIDLDASATTANEWQRATLNGRLTAQAQLDQISGGLVRRAALDLDAEGLLDTQGQDTYIVLRGRMPGLEALGHTWSDVALSGVLENQKANGLVDIDDAWARCLLVLEADRNGVQPYRSLAVRLDHLDLQGLGALPDKAGASVSLKARLESVGDDPLTGEAALNVARLHYTDERDTLTIDKLRVESYRDDVGQRRVSLDGDLLRGSLRGDFTVLDLRRELLYQAGRALPSLVTEAEAPQRPPMTELDLRLLRLGEVARLFAPDLTVGDTLAVRGRIDGESHSAWLNAHTAGAAYGGQSARGLTAAALSIDGDVTGGVQADTVTAPVIGRVADLSLACEARDDRVSVDALWGGDGSNDGALNMLARFSRDDQQSLVTAVDIDRSRLCLFDQPWTLDSCAMVFTDRLVDVGRFQIANERNPAQFILARGQASASANDTLTVALNKIVLEDLIHTDEESPFNLAGDLYSQIDVRGALGGSPQAEGHASIRRLMVCDDQLGRLDVAGSLERDTIALALDIITGGAVRGHSDGLVSLASNYLDLPFVLDSLSTGFLNFYLSSSIDSWRGSTTGDLRLHGPLSDLKLDAHLGMNNDNWFRVKQTNVRYHIDRQDTVLLTPTLIGFQDIRFTDGQGHRCLFSGGIDHHMYSGLVYHMRFDVDRALLLATTAQNSPTYYGNVYGSGFMSIRGTTSDIKININARTDKGSTFSVVPTARGDLSEQNYITFRRRGERNESVYERLDRIGSVTAALSLDVTPDAELAIVMNPATGNALKGRGDGAVRVAIDNDGELSMFGQYNITGGEYNFSFENIINKKFDIKPGSTVSWNGDPYDALLDVVATYKIKASLYDLVAGSGEAVSPDLKRRVPINCNILLSNKLTNPDIAFDIEIPSSQNFNQYTFEQYVSTPDEMNRQVFSLLLSGRFFNSQRQDNLLNDSPAMLSQTATEMLSNQLSRLISDNKANLGVGVSYRPGDQIQNEEYELRLSTSVLNDKILLSGNIGYGRDVSGAPEGGKEGQVIGDFDVEVKINRPGTLRAKAYTHSNNDVVYETSPTTQGVGLSFQEEFDSFRGLAMRYKAMMQRRRQLRAEKKALKQAK